MLLKASVFSLDYRGSSAMLVRLGPWTMIQFCAINLLCSLSSPRHERDFRRPALALTSSPGPEGTNSSKKDLTSNSLSRVLACLGSLYEQGRSVSAERRARAQCFSPNSRHQDCSNSSLGAIGSTDYLLNSCKSNLNTSLGISIPTGLNSGVLLTHTIPLNILVS